MISICTAAHKIIPWMNLRIINICNQSFKDWEWVVLDNSEDGCVKKYFDEFFESKQGACYSECREKVKVYHEPFIGVGIKDGRIGKIKNRAIQLSTCKNDEFFVLLDFDDFLVDGFLNTLDEIATQRPDIEYVNGECITELCQNIENGEFFINNYVSDNFLTQPYDDHINKIWEYGCGKMNGFASYIEHYKNSSHERFVVVPVNVKLEFPPIGVVLNLKQANKVNTQFFYLNTYLHPQSFRKGTFFEKLNGFCETLPSEDVVNIRIPYTLKTMYIQKPCYVQVAMVSNYDIRVSGTSEVEDVLDSGEYIDLYKEYAKNCCWERYKVLGENMMTPIPFEFYVDAFE